MEYSGMSTATGSRSSKRVVGRKGSEYLLFVSWLRCMYVFGRQMVGSPGVFKRAVELARLLHGTHI